MAHSDRPLSAMHALLTLAIALVLAMPAIPTAAQSAPPDAEALDRGSDLAYRRALAPAATDKQLNADAIATARTRRIANRLVVSAGTMDAESKRFGWAVNLVPGTAPDVRVYPGGRVLVSDGLIEKSGLTDEEFGAILAHAFAHSLLGHDARQLEPKIAAKQGSADPNRRTLEVADAITEAMRGVRYTPAEVEAADRMSIEIMARAALDPRAAGSAWRRVRLGSKGIVERTPVSDERLATLDATIRAAIPLYEETRARAEAYARSQRPPRITGPSKGGPPLR